MAKLTLRSIDVVESNFNRLVDLSRSDLLRDLPCPKANLRDLSTVVELDTVERHISGRITTVKSWFLKKKTCVYTCLLVVYDVLLPPLDFG